MCNLVLIKLKISHYGFLFEIVFYDFILNFLFMSIFQNPKSFLELIGKDTTLLGSAILLLYIENIYQLSNGMSLINNKNIDFTSLINFKFFLLFMVSFPKN